MIRQRQLYEYAVDRGVGIQFIHQGKDLLLARIGGQFMLHGVKSAGFGRSLFIANINLARRIFANDDDREPRAHVVAGCQFGCRLRYLGC